MSPSVPRFIRNPEFIGATAIGAAFLALYTYTLAPDILGHDVADWQAAGVTLGISHSPGSPAYTILSWLVSRVPVGNAAARVSFVSALMGAAGVVAVFVFMLLLLDRWLPAVVAAVTLGLGGQWWSQASVAQPYNSVATVVAVLLILLLLWHRKGDVRLVWGGALLTGVELAYHPSLLYFIPVLLAGMIILGPWRKLLSPKPLAVTAALLLAGLSLYAYLPIRGAMNPVILSEKITSLPHLFRFVTVSNARSTGTFSTEIPGQGELRERLSEVVRQGYFPSYAFLVFAPALTLLYPTVLRRLKKNRRFLLFLLGGALAHMAIVFVISGIYVQYYLPLLVYFALWAGFSIYLIMIVAEDYLDDRRLAIGAVSFAVAIYAVVLALGLPHIWPYVNHNDDRSMRAFTRWTFSQAKPGAVILANWESYTGLIYVQKVDGQRPDVKIISVAQDAWRQTANDIEHDSPGKQILLARTLPFDDGEGASPVGPVYFLDIKGRTYQNHSHGQPYASAVELFEVRQ